MLEIRAADNRAKISLGLETQANIQNVLRATELAQEPAEERVTIKGTLRALHLDKDWLEVVSDGRSVKIVGLKDSLDDIVGPMVNRPVIVTAFESQRKLRLIDIEREE